ncbi:MAG: M20/M25/M40 family metallo-hydrolase [Deltaproteobacteria bacterium]|nr:M20/M25/M40 family metallo-hydrolase [Deltaproteobacteria bacterium]
MRNEPAALSVVLLSSLLLLTACPGEDSDGADGGVDGGAPVCGTATAGELVRCVEEARYSADLAFIAEERVPGSTHWQAVQDRIAGRLEELGFTVELHDYGTGINVIGTLPGTTTPTEEVLVGAHYDHIPGCPGANDNATGVAGALEIARVLSQAAFERTLVVAFWDEEERGLLGSIEYVTRADANGQDIVASFNYDMIGFKDDTPDSQTIPDGLDLLFPDEIGRLADRGYRGDFIAAIRDFQSEAVAFDFFDFADALGLEYADLPLSDALKNSPMVSDLRRSDHAPFWMAEYPAIFLSDSGEFRSDTYHCRGSIDDTATLDDAFAAQVVGATLGAMAEALVIDPTP